MITKWIERKIKNKVLFFLRDVERIKKNIGKRN